MTAFLLEGRSQAWLDQLTRLRVLAREVRLLYPGHGEPGPPETLIRQQEKYLETFRSLVFNALSGGKLSHDAPERIASAMRERYPGYEPVAAIPDLLVKNADPIARELSQAS